MIFLEFIEGAALLLSLAMLNTFTLRFWRKETPAGQVASGMVFGCVAIVGMAVSLHLLPGVFFDPRSVILSIAGFWGGPIVGVVAGTIAATYRFWLGGSGAATGIAVVASSVVIGVTYRFLSRRYDWPVGPWALLAFGLAVHLVVVLWMLTLPGDVAGAIIRKVALPNLLVFVPATMILGLLLGWIDRHFETERRLRESEKRFVKTFRASPVAMSVLRIDDGLNIDVNDEWQAMTGHSRDEAVGKTDVELGCWPDMQQRAAFKERIRHDASVRGFEATLLTKNGMARDIILASDTIQIGGEPRLLLAFQDITARKRMEGELRRLNRVYRTLSLCTQVLVKSDSEEALIGDVCRTIVESGGYACAAVGVCETDGPDPIRAVALACRSQEPAGTPHVPWNDPDGPIVAAIHGRTAQVIGRDGGSAAGLSFMRESGLTVLAAIPLCSGGQTIGVLAVFGDSPGDFGRDAVVLLEELATDMAFGIVALRTTAAHAMAEAEMRKLLRAVEQIPSMVVITDAEGAIEYVNPRFAEITGYDMSEAAGKKIHDLVGSGEMVPEEYEKFWETIRAGKEWRGLFHNRRKDGSLYWCGSAISPVFDQSGKITHFVAIQNDVTERLETERRLQHADKMDSLGNLAGGIAHDFNNMLLPIGTLTAMVLQEMDPESKARQRLERVLEATARAQDLARRILSFSRVGDLQAQAHDISEIASDTAALLNSTLYKTVTLDVRIAPDLRTVASDRAEIETVILNLANNAADAMGGKPGTLRLSLDGVRLKEPLKGAISTVPAGSYARLTIGDTGTGIDSDTLNRIFDPYYTTKAEGAGTGLGLAMVRTIVLKCGGTITVESEPGDGTTFLVYLPLMTEFESGSVGQR